MPILGHCFPVYHAHTAKLMGGNYFRKLTPFQRGDTYVCTKCRPRPVQILELSYIVVKRNRRKGTERHYIQRSTPAARVHRYPRWVYVIASSDYLVCSIAWADGAITELQAFGTKKEAQKKAKELQDSACNVSG
jgi:hypothetical protein